MEKTTQAHRLRIFNSNDFVKTVCYNTSERKNTPPLVYPDQISAAKTLRKVHFSLAADFLEWLLNA
jgi:hypothetical protein